MNRRRKLLLAACLAVVGLFAVACGSSDMAIDAGATTAAPAAAPTTAAPAATTTSDAATTSESMAPAAASSSDATGELAFGLRRCDRDQQVLAADPAFYRDEPIYVGNEQPTDAVRAWASTKPGFESIWVDRNHNGWIGVGFSSGAAERQAELEAEFPGVGVAAVAVLATEAELLAVRSEVEDALDGLSSWASGHSVAHGVVDIYVPVLDEETLARLAPFASPLLCVDGTDPVDAIPDGPQATAGDGWRLLGTDRTGSSYRTGLATSDDQYQVLWQVAGVLGDRPAVDFDAEVVVWFGAVYGSNCPIRLDGVIIDLDQRLVHGDFVIPGNPTVCNDDANPEAYVVAVPRDRLPEAPFAIQLDADDPPAGVPEERTTVNVDVRPAGSFAAPKDLVVRYLGDNPPPRANVFGSGWVIEPGYPSTVLMEVSCLGGDLGELNGTMWRPANADDGWEVPVEWTRDLNDGLAEAELALSTDPARLVVTINGIDAAYDPVPVSDGEAMTCG